MGNRKKSWLSILCQGVFHNNFWDSQQLLGITCGPTETFSELAMTFCGIRLTFGVIWTRFEGRLVWSHSQREINDLGLVVNLGKLLWICGVQKLSPVFSWLELHIVLFLFISKLSILDFISLFFFITNFDFLLWKFTFYRFNFLLIFIKFRRF